LRPEFLSCWQFAPGSDAGLKTFAWLDGAQVLIAAMLAYLQLFSVLPSRARPEAISATNLIYFEQCGELDSGRSEKLARREDIE